MCATVRPKFWPYRRLEYSSRGVINDDMAREKQVSHAEDLLH